MTTNVANGDQYYVGRHILTEILYTGTTVMQAFIMKLDKNLNT